MPGMDMMLASLIGMKPEQMKQEIQAMINAVRSTAAFMQSMDERLKKIEERLNIPAIEEGKENG